MKNPLFDREFIKELHEFPEREVYAKVISLDLDEHPIEEITGHVTQGSITVDGTSAVRRTCSLTMIAESIDINEYYWGLNTKIQLYVGLKNFINSEYPDIIWFPQGLYLLTAFSTAQSVQGYNINLQGKDKMCLLNGDLGGTITELSVDFGKIEVEDTDENGNGLGTYTKENFLLKDIITEAVHKYGQQPYGKIIINDLDDIGLELYEYRGKTPAYATFNHFNGDIGTLFFNEKESKTGYVKPTKASVITPVSQLNMSSPHMSLSNNKFYINDGGVYIQCAFQIFSEDEDNIYYAIVDTHTKINYHNRIIVDNLQPTQKIDYLYTEKFTQIPEFTMKDLNETEFDQRFNLQFTAVSEPLIVCAKTTSAELGTRYIEYSFIRIETGETVGYKITNLTYAGDLIGAIGNSITSAVLDPIVKQLGEFEYYYDDNGNFIFQKKKTFVDSAWNNLETNSYDFTPVIVSEAEYQPGMYYIRENGEYLICYTPEYKNIRQKNFYLRTPNETYANALSYTDRYSYSFENSRLISSFSNTPALNNVKNDYSLWGTRKGISGADIPIHLRYAIERKPISYTNYEGTTYTVLSEEEFIEPYLKEELNKYQNIDFQKSPMPDCLDPNDWWEVHDWAEYYHLILGEYPTASMGQYITEWTQMDLNTFFPAGSTWNKEGILFLFDVNDDGTLGFVGHNPGTGYEISDDHKTIFRKGSTTPISNSNFCGHEYKKYFVDKDITAYFFKPTIPGRQYTANLEDSIKQELKTRFSLTHYNCEWREVLYQMAADNLKYGHEDDYYAIIAENNGDLYPDGSTGYEQYYTDMQGFWRDLYNPYLDKFEMFTYEEVKDKNTLQQDFSSSRRTKYYKKIDGYYIQVQKEEVYNDKYKYFTRVDTDSAEHHPLGAYYQLNAEETGYIKLTEENVTSLYPVDISQKYYYKSSGGEYLPYTNFDEQVAYFTHKTFSDLAGLDPFAKYFTLDGKPYQFKEYFDVYDIATSFEEKDKKNYYFYNSKTGKYESCGDLEGFSANNTYYILRKYPVLYPDDKPLAVDNGYKPITEIKRNVQYYIKACILQEDGSATYEYQKSFKLHPTDKYYITDGGTRVEVINFARGKTYEDINRNRVTIPLVNLYYQDGIQSVDKANTLTVNDSAYYFDDNGHKVYLPQGGVILGKPIYFYQFETSNIQNNEEFSEGNYYTYNSTLGFERKRVLKNFTRPRQYFVAEGDEYIQDRSPYSEKKEYYLQAINALDNSIIGYYKYSDILDFSTEVSLTLYIINDDMSITSSEEVYGNTYVYEKNKKVASTHRLVPVNRKTAVFDENTIYFLNIHNTNNFYQVFKNLTEDNFNGNRFNLFVKNKNLTFTRFKHMYFTESGVLTKVNDKLTIPLSKQYYESPNYNPQTKWTYTLETPEMLNFWIDFLDTDGEISKYSNHVIGNRPKTENDTKVNAIYYRETPQVIFVDETISQQELSAQKELKQGYSFLRINNGIKSLFSLSSQGKSLFDTLDDDLYKYSYCTESVSITCLPVYTLQPNTRIFIKDAKAGINGEYIISRITIPLAYNGTMNISAIKAVERIY